MSNKQTSHRKGLSIFLILLLVVICASIFFFLEFSQFANPKEVYVPETATQSTQTIPEQVVQETENNADPTPADDPSAPVVEDRFEIPDYPVSPARVTYEEGFYYEPVSGNTELMERIRSLSFNETNNQSITFDELSYVRVRYIGFHDQEEEGEIICNQRIAQDLVEIFHELYKVRYQIESLRLVDDFGADDNQSMEANNSSSFNYRAVTGSQEELSKHAQGLAIDINPMYNPYVKNENGVTTVLPASATAYSNRSQEFSHKIDENDFCYQLFTQHGFTWGGQWQTLKDYQHFEK